MPADPPTEATKKEKQAAAQQAVDVLHEIATILNTYLDRRTLSICISMIENGVSPESLATAIKQLRQEKAEAAASAGPPSKRHA